MIETDTTAIATVDEMELANETYDQLVADQEYEKAVAMGEEIMNRVDSVSSAWQKKLNEVRPILKQRQWKIDNEKYWKESDARVKRFKKHQPQLWELMLQELGRSAESRIRRLNIKGDETHACGVLEYRYRGEPNFCGTYTDDKTEMHQHWIAGQHRKPGAWLKGYPTLVAVSTSSGKLHREGTHASSYHRNPEKFYLINNYLQSFGGGATAINNLCKQCYPQLKEICDDCGAPADKKGVCVLNHD